MNLLFKKKPKTYGELMKEKHGEDFFANVGRKGGLRKVPKGFAINRELARQAGKIGGERSKRGPSVNR